MNTADQLVRQLGGLLLRFVHDALGLARECATCRQGIKSGARSREKEPTGPEHPTAFFLSLGGIRHVCESFCEIDYLFRDLIDICHFGCFLRLSESCDQPSRSAGTETGTARAVARTAFVWAPLTLSDGGDAERVSPRLA